MKKGLILVNAYWKSETEIYQADRLREEFAALGVEIRIRRNNYFPVHLRCTGSISPLAEAYDFCIYLDKDKYTSYLLEQSGLRLFNRHDAIVACDDKLLTYFALRDAGIAIPRTFAGLLCYTPSEKVAKETLDIIESELSYPLVVKESFGSMGKGVYKADNREELESIAEQVKCKPHLFQEYIAESAGRDLRVLVVGGKVVAAMKRISDGDFRSNAALGGRGESYPLDAAGEVLALKIARVMGLDYCGIDFLFGKNGYVLCEVNSNAFFAVAERVTGANIAGAYAAYIYKEIYGE